MTTNAAKSVRRNITCDTDWRGAHHRERFLDLPHGNRSLFTGNHNSRANSQRGNLANRANHTKRLLATILAAAYAFSQGELMVIYVMMAIGAVICGLEFIETLVHSIGHPAAYATPENDWANLFISHLPKWLIIHSDASRQGLLYR